ncbi:MAG: PAS domain-containing sensor histidine kinase [Methylotenera sp.]|uniref:ATP-binding protein n=1 Tax=Methylotenera sp. TaxID=2051956 RepID=UPI0027282929|nr:PAS domain-containing sensor histidine kinase [Methylotenera sp.]MDO9393042.1 PAS domain-containing sensor histidine kinase [Methylotenera sp.]
MITASLVVIAIVSGLLYQHQIQQYEAKVRDHGVALSRALSSAEYAQLVSGTDKGSLMRNLVNVQNNEDFAYGVIVNTTGEKLNETTSAGSIVPAAAMPTEPFAWFGEHNLISPGDGRQIREFFAPIMLDGQLAGFVRIGYYSQPTNILSGQISSLALMALPIFLLTTLSYFLIRREIKPLSQLSQKMEQASLSYGVQVAAPMHGQDMGDFIQRFDQFIQLVQSRVSNIDAQAASAQTVTHLLSYKNKKAESALNSIPDAVLVIDDACIPTFANQKIEPLLSVNRDDIIGQPPQDWCKNKVVLEFLMRFKSASTAKHNASIELVPFDNPDRRILVSAFPLFSPHDQNTLFGMLIVFRDISKEHLAKQAGAEFVSHVSHELKTPLNTLSAYSELLLDYSTLAETERVDAVNVIHGEVERMSALINNLLNISKMETGTLQLARKRVKMQDLLQDAFDSMNNNALGKGVEISLKIPPDIGSVRLDKEMFRIAIDNLLSNAIKYSNAGGKVTLSAQNLDNDEMQITVRDQGIGISPEDCEKIFNKYYRANNSETTLRSGHGLGLFITKQIIEMHHGMISVNSELGKGTEFTITFKAQPVQLEEALAA